MTDPTSSSTPTGHEAGTFAVIGGGNMGAALAGGLLSSNWIEASRMAIVEVVAPLRASLVERFPGVTITDSVPPCTAAVIAVKPPDAPAATSAPSPPVRRASCPSPRVSRSPRWRPQPDQAWS